jgi:predicted XRE-type DNA-binding protein
VWDALADTPEQAANLRARAELMQQIAAMARNAGGQLKRPYSFLALCPPRLPGRSL